MSLGSDLAHALGVIVGILIPGTSNATATLTNKIQNELAKVYGKAAADLADKLKTDTTGLTGPQKVFHITEALVLTAKKDGFKGDLKVLGDVALDIAQAAYRASEPTIGADIIALAAALSANPLVTVAAELVAPVVQHAADEAGEKLGLGGDTAAHDGAVAPALAA